MTGSPYAALRFANFRRLLVSQALLTLAREAEIVVVGWQVYQVTGDPLALGLIGLSEALPFIGFVMFAGHFADRVERQRVVLAGMTAVTLSGVALLAMTLTPGAIAPGHIWPIYLIIAFSAVGRSFMRPSIYALSAELVPRELYPNAVAWRTSAFHIAAVAGPAVGGLLYGLRGPAAAYAATVAAMTLSLVVMMSLRHRPGSRPQRQMLPLAESILGGLRFVWSEPVLLGAMTLDLFAVLFGGAVALLPAFAKLLGAGPEGLGLLRAAPAVGSIVTGLWIAHRPPMRRAGRTLLVAVGGFGLCMISFALSRAYWLSFGLLLLSGVFDNVSVVIRSTLLQTRTPEHLLGRVASINQIFIGSSNEIGAFESGLAAKLLGVVPSVLFGGSVTLVVVALVAWRWPSLRRLRELNA